MLERSIPIEGPLDLRSTLRPLHGAYRSDGWWYSALTAAGPATIQLSRTRGELTGRAWGAGGAMLLERLGDFAGLNDDPLGFETPNPIVSELLRRNPGVRFGRNGQVFSELVIAVTAQKVTATEAHRAMRGLYEAFSEPAPGPRPDIRLPPDPEKLAAAPYWAFHELHLEKKRADVIRRAATEASRIDGLAAESVPVAASGLAQLTGVGQWTIAETLVRSHGDVDAVSVGDFHLKNLVVYHLTGRPRGTDEEMVELLEEFRPQRGRVVRLLHQLGHAPKYGPKTTPRNITRY